MTLFEASRNDEIRRAAAYALGYVCDKETSKILFDAIEMAMKNEINDSSNYPDDVLSTLISSYSHCASICNFEFDQDDINLFRELLKHSSRTVVKAAHIGLGRVLKNSSLLFEMLDSDYIQCYHALMGSTAYISMYKAYDISTEAVVDFIEKHPDLLSIFIVELYQSIRHFNNTVKYLKTMDYRLAYGYPQYVRVAELITVRMPATFCAFIKDWCDGDNLKHALFYISKQHDYVQRAACLTILSVFGELTVELCEMIIHTLRDDPHIQNTCYKCLTRITSIKDEKIVLNLLFAYLKSKSMNVRYVTAKLLLHLSQSSLISFDQVQTILFDVMLDPNSNEDLWLIEEQDDIRAKCMYYYAGPLKDVIYSLLVRHLTGDASTIIRRNELNDIDKNFTESETAARLASCLYEKKIEENLLLINPTYVKSVD
jgi:HEAT repeat protein